MATLPTAVRSRSSVPRPEHPGTRDAMPDHNPAHALVLGATDRRRHAITSSRQPLILRRRVHVERRRVRIAMYRLVRKVVRLLVPVLRAPHGTASAGRTVSGIPALQRSAGTHRRLRPGRRRRGRSRAVRAAARRSQRPDAPWSDSGSGRQARGRRNPHRYGRPIWGLAIMLAWATQSTPAWCPALEMQSVPVKAAGVDARSITPI